MSISTFLIIPSKYFLKNAKSIEFTRVLLLTSPYMKSGIVGVGVTADVWVGITLSLNTAIIFKSFEGVSVMVSEYVSTPVTPSQWSNV